MNTRLMCIAGAWLLLPMVQAADAKSTGRYLATPLKGDYYLYGGSIGDKTPPTQTDRKLALMLTGDLAKDLFDHIGPDTRQACGGDLGYRERSRGDLSCTHTREYGYACYLGINAITGKSIRGSIC